MNFKLPKLGTFLLLFVGVINLQAQETVPASGGESSGDGGSASYTIGQMIYTENNSPSGAVSHGVQQSFEIYVVSAIDETMGINLEIAAYPNPVTDYLILSFSNNIENKQYRAALYNFSGKLIKRQVITSNKTRIEMGTLVSAVYLLKIEEQQNTVGQEIKVFKIIKR